MSVTYFSEPDSGVIVTASKHKSVAIKNDLVDVVKTCPICEMVHGMLVRPSGDPLREGRHTEEEKGKIHLLCNEHSYFSNKSLSTIQKTPT